MMAHLIYKEFRLAAHPTLYIFILLGCLVIIPGYPYSTVFLYGCLAPFITLCNGRENQDAFYTAFLPVKKRDVVKAKYMLFIIAELAQLIISVPFAYLSTRLFAEGNPVGIDANIAYYGFGLIIFTVFNMIFFTEFYKTAYKVGKAFLLGIIPVTVMLILMESLVHIEAFAWLDSVESTMLIRQMPILIIGILVYIVGNMFACHIAEKNFEKVDL